MGTSAQRPRSEVRPTRRDVTELSSYVVGMVLDIVFNLDNAQHQFYSHTRLPTFQTTFAALIDSCKLSHLTPLIPYLITGIFRSYRCLR